MIGAIDPAYDQADEINNFVSASNVYPSAPPYTSTQPIITQAYPVNSNSKNSNSIFNFGFR